MATVKEAMDDAALQCSVAIPTSWITNTTLTYQEMRLFLRQTVDELLERIDWPDPITTDYVITGVAGATFALPAGFQRLTRDPMAVYETTTTRRACIPVSSNGAWTFLEDTGSAGGDRFYRLSGDEASGFRIEFYRPLAIGNKVTVSYVSKNWLATALGVAGTSWTLETDVLRLPKRLVELGVVWRFRRRKGLEYLAMKAEYETHLTRKANDRRQIKTIDMGSQDGMRRPWNIPVPDVIPRGP